MSDFDRKAAVRRYRHPFRRDDDYIAQERQASVGSFGDSYANALAETNYGLYKAEVIHRRGPWRSFEAVEFATLECRLVQSARIAGADRQYPASRG
jgi:transposase InsO family protein